MPINGEAARSARLPNRPVAESNDQYCVGGVLDVGLAVDQRLRQGTLRDHHQEPDHHRSGREDADLVGAEKPAQHKRLNNGGGLSDHQADGGHRRSALEHTAQARRGVGHSSPSRGARAPARSSRLGASPRS